EGSNKRDRDRDRGNKRAAPVLQKNENYKHDESDRLEQSVEHVFNRFADDGCRIKCDGILDAGREVLRKALELGLCCFINSERIGAGQLSDAEPDSVVAIEAENTAVILSPQFGASHIAHTHQIAVGTCLQDDVFKF